MCKKCTELHFHEKALTCSYMDSLGGFSEIWTFLKPACFSDLGLLPYDWGAIGFAWLCLPVQIQAIRFAWISLALKPHHSHALTLSTPQPQMQPAASPSCFSLQHHIVCPLGVNNPLPWQSTCTLPIFVVVLVLAKSFTKPC